MSCLGNTLTPLCGSCNEVIGGHVGQLATLKQVFAGDPDIRHLVGADGVNEL